MIRVRKRMSVITSIIVTPLLIGSFPSTASAAASSGHIHYSGKGAASSLVNQTCDEDQILQRIWRIWPKKGQPALTSATSVTYYGDDNIVYEWSVSPVPGKRYLEAYDVSNVVIPTPRRNVHIDLVIPHEAQLRLASSTCVGPGYAD